MSPSRTYYGIHAETQRKYLEFCLSRDTQIA